MPQSSKIQASPSVHFSVASVQSTRQLVVSKLCTSMGPLEVHGVLLRILYSRPSNIVILLILDAIIWLQRPDIVDFHNRVQDIPPQFIYDVYDFIVVGGGSAGAAVAARLSEVCDWNVLLLEAGQDETYLSDIPYLYPTLQKSNLDWKFETVPDSSFCQGMENKKCAWPRGKVLGGSSVLNAMMYVRGNSEDYDEWENLGNVGWGWKDVLPYFIKMENVRDPKIADKPWHGTTGPMTVELFRNRSVLEQYFIEAAKHLGHEIADEMNGPDQNVFGPLHGSIRDGLRCSTAKAYLRPVWKRPNLHVSMNTMVEKILIDPGDKRAYGVKFTKNNQHHYVMALKEVILSAGALNSPHLLMLSGVGPKAELQAHGIEVIHDSPGVGKNLQDHVATGGVTFLIDNPYKNGSLSVTIFESTSKTAVLDLVFDNSGTLMDMPSCQLMGFINTKFQPEGSKRPDIQIFMSAQSDLSDGGAWAAYGSSLSYNYYAQNFERWIFHDSFLVMPLVMRPQSRGYLKLNSNDPYDKILIYPNYFSVRRDMDVMIEGLKYCVKLAQTPALASLNPKFIYDVAPSATCQNQEGDSFYECLVRHFSQTIYHPVGTTAMGPKTDKMAVVDAQLRVYGVAGLRVVDGGIMPTITTGNTNAPIIMIAEKATDLIKADYLPQLLKQQDLKPCDTYNYEYH
ncbi:glucose dehydrogenase [FAD, quinone]-like [Toxorhynchites rutilus septentrionalis]|uniref:glucose dehydrogenase [FAD, quinone]-like n=1 Tax=Toxorhynchites rutilus septentrionalis TaxID=329112 RepID=UPI00247AC76A|nr:glucose dehydrogenase [FAD, quinone]-like [Toxorhynchites rutilus septentrionalis]